jgi:hypothetical protein
MLDDTMNNADNPAVFEAPESLKTKPTLQDAPYFFGNYLNMARHNAFVIIKDLHAKYEVTDDQVKTDADMMSSKLFVKLNETQYPDIVQDIVKDLRQHFPFLNHLSREREGIELNTKEISRVLRQSFKLLNRFRNAYSHHIAVKSFLDEEDKRVDKKTGKSNRFPFLDIYASALEKIIKTFKFEAKDVAHLEINGERPSKYLPDTLTDDYTNDKTLAFFICLFIEPQYANLRWSNKNGHKILLILCYGKEQKKNNQSSSAV